MFAKETYIQRRAVLKQAVGSGLLLFLGNDDQGLNYEDNAFRYRQDSTFLYYFGLSAAGLSAIIDIDNDREIIFGDELTIDHIIWMGVLPTLRDNASLVGISDVRPSAQLKTYLQQAQQSKQTIHYLPTYRAEHSLKLLDWLGLMPAQQAPSIPFIRAIVAQRKTHPFSTTAEFASLCDQVLRRGFRKGGPPTPTLCFQALRIEVNDELGQLERALHSALEMLKPGGRLCVISFHSLEDRIVKQFMNSMAEKCKCPPKMPQCICNWKPLLEVLTKKPVTASEEELKENPRSACAKLRCAQRTEHPVRKEEQKKTTGTEGGLGK
jgi:hypothetical protein